MNENRKTIKLKNKTENTDANKANENNNNAGKIFEKKSFKLKFNKYLLIELLKKTRLRKLSEKKNKAKNSNSSRFNNFNNTQKQLNTQDQLINKIYKNFQDYPEMKKFHNITLETLSDLIKSNDSMDKSSQYPKFRYPNMNLKIKPNDNNGANSSKKKFQNIFNMKKSNFSFYKNAEKNIIKNRYQKYTTNTPNIKKMNLNLNDLNLNKENMLPLLSTNSNESKQINKKYPLSQKKVKKIAENNELTPKKKFMSKISKENQTNKWLESIRDSIKKYDILHRSSRIDRLIFVIENPEGCFEENLMEERPGDKYIMLKNQMIRRKDKFENIIREIKLNQKKSEYLMKKYIFDLLSRKKSVYKG